MKNKFLLIFAALSFFIAESGGQVRTVEEALAVAQAFFPDKAHPVKLAYTSKNLLRSGADKNCFYAFNHGEGNGYVLVSADERAKEVLGYAGEGTFDFANLPENFKYWLAFYEAEMAALDNPVAKTPSPAPKLARPVMASAGALEPVVRPLLQTKWGQDEPYNDLCPAVGGADSAVNPASAGCVATVMAQVMRYYQWPVQGKGTHAYTPQATGKELSVDFGATVYDWANMPNKYTGNEGHAARNAVATLMYHCGVAVDMSYDSDGSGAYDIDVPSALETYFGYDPAMNIYFRDYYSHEDWAGFIKAELTAKRPVYYSGSTGDGGYGHAFVCDGYNAEGLFHFNWGWNGFADGYFELSALNPNTPGAGGGWEGYNYFQSIITGIQPFTGASAPSARLGFSSISSNKTALASVTEKFDINLAGVMNRGNKSFTGFIGIAVCRAGDSIANYTKVYQLNGDGLPPYWGYDEFSFTNFSLPRSLSAGTYKIIPAYSGIVGAATLMEPAAGQIQALTVVISQGGKVSISPAAAEVPALELKRFEPLANLYQGKAGEFTAVVLNTGTADYNADLALSFAGELIREPVVVAPGAVKAASFSKVISAAPGAYIIKLLCQANNGGWVAMDSISVTVNPPPSTPAALSTLSATFPDAAKVDKESPKLSAVIKNAGGFYDGAFTAGVFPDKGGYSIASFGYQHAVVDSGQTKTFLFNTPIDLPAGAYLAAVFYQKDRGWEQLSMAVPFTLSTPVANGNAPPDGLRVSLTASVLSLESNDLVEEIAIYDMGGRLQARFYANSPGTVTVPIQQLAPAAYILRVQTKGKVQTTKFIKK